MIWAVLTKIQAHIGSSPKEIIKKLETLSLQQNIAAAVKACLRYVIQVAKMHQLVGDISSYVLDRPEEYVQLYTNTLYKIDGSYRRAIASYKNLDIQKSREHLVWSKYIQHSMQHTTSIPISLTENG